MAEKYGLLHYEFDRRAITPEQLERAKAPRAFEWFEKSPDELWQQQSPEEIAAHSLETYEEIFPIQLEDLLKVGGNKTNDCLACHQSQMWFQCDRPAWHHKQRIVVRRRNVL